MGGLEGVEGVEAMERMDFVSLLVLGVVDIQRLIQKRPMQNSYIVGQILTLPSDIGKN